MKKIFVFLLFAVAFLIAGLQPADAATRTWLPTIGGAWTTAASWSGGVAPVAGDDVIINSDQSANITAVPTIALNSLSVSGTCTLVGAVGGAKTITIGGAAGTDFTVSSGKTLSIGGNLNITLAAAAAATIDGTLTVTAGRTFTTDAAGVVTTVNGTITATGTVTCTNATRLLFQSGSTYNHNQDGGTIPTATWNSASTCLITGVTATMPGGIGQSFGNFTWNNAAQTGNLYFASNMTITGNFTITATNTGSLRVSGTGTGYTVSVTGNFSQSNGEFRLNNSTGSCSMTVGGNFTITGGLCTLVSGGANSSITVSGNVNVTVGTLTLSEDTGIGTLNVAGNFSFTSGTITETAGGSGLIVFNGSTTQTYTSGGTVSNTINFTVNNGAFLQMAVPGTIVSGAGTFTLSAGGKLGITSPNGIVSLGTASGNIQTTVGRVYNAGANYVYNGTANQATGTGYPTALTGSLTIDNPGNTVTIVAAARTITTGTLNLTNGTFATNNGGNRLSLGSTATVNRSGGSLTGTLQGAGVYNVNYTGSSKTTGEELGGSGLNNVSVNLTGGQTLTLDQARTPDGDLTITTGTFDLSTFTFNRSAAGGTLTVSNGATLKIGGTNSFPTNYNTHTLGASSTVEYSGTAQTISVETYGNLTLSGSGAKTPGGNLTVAGGLTINSGPVMTLSSSQQLTVSGTTTLGGTDCLVIQSDGTGTGSFIDNGFAGAGTALMERYISNSVWHYICIPMTSINAWTYLDRYMKYYSEPEHHFRYVIASGSDSTLNSDGLGYAMWATANWTILQSGTLNSGTINIPVTRTYDTGTTDYDGWNLVGNPYASAVDLSLLTGSWTNVEATAWFWDPGALNYKVYPTGGGGNHTKYCPQEQGFFVHCDDPGATQSTPGSGTVVMNHAARVHNSETFLKNTDDPMNLLRILAEGTINSSYDETSVYFSDARSDAYEPGFDAEKISGEVIAPQIYTTIPDYNLAVNALPFSQSNMVVPMGFKENLADTYTLTASGFESFQPDVTIQLEDLQESIIQDLRTNPVYTFSHVMADDPNRFLLHFGDPNLGIQDITGSNAVDVYSYGERVYVRINGTGEISGNISVYDIIGREVYRNQLSGSPMQEFSLPGLHGYYIVRVTGNQGNVNEKIFL